MPITFDNNPGGHLKHRDSLCSFPMGLLAPQFSVDMTGWATKVHPSSRTNLSSLIFKGFEGWRSNPEHCAWQVCASYSRIFFFLIIIFYYILIQYTPNTSSLPSTLPSSPKTPLLSPHIQCSFSDSLKKRSSLPRDINWTGMPRCNKTSYKSSYQDWIRQPSRNKRDPRAGKRVRYTPFPLLGVPPKF